MTKRPDNRADRVSSPGLGSSLDADYQLVSQLEGVFRDAGERAKYTADARERVKPVLGILDTLRGHGVGRLLELGANPYVMTLLIRRRYDFAVELANFFGDARAGSIGTDSATLGGERLEFPFRHFNVEREPFPYPDHSFDCVLFCEILEHLLLDPDHALAEIARVLRPRGFVIVSTPNATRLTNLYFMALGKSVWEWYSENGAYGRHNREFTLVEVQDLLTRHGFNVFSSDVRNIQHLARRFTWIQWMRPTIWYEHLFVVGRKP